MKYKSISKWFSMLLLMMVAGVTSVQAQSLAIEDFSIKAGETKDVAINLVAGTTETPVYGIQTDLTLSEGLSLKTATAADGAGNVYFNEVGTGIFRFAQLSLKKNTPIPAGAVITLTIEADENFAGNGTITMSDTKLATSTDGAADSEISISDPVTVNVDLDEAPVVYEYYLVGEDARLGLEWPIDGELGEKAVKLEVITGSTEGFYGVSFEGIKYQAGDAITFKFVSSSDGKTVAAWYPGGDNLTKTVAEDGVYDVTFMFNEENLTVDACLTLEKKEDLNYTYFVAGKTGEVEDGADDIVFGKAWVSNVEANVMIPDNSVEGKLVWSKTVEFEGATSLAAKVVVNNGLSDAWYPAENMTATIDQAGTWDIVMTFNSTTNEATLTATRQVVLNTYTATFTTNAEWEEVYAYTWSGEGDDIVEQLGAWPGTKLEKDAQGVYTVTIEAEAAPEKIAFNNGQSGEGNQTDDFAFVNEQAYEYTVDVPEYAYYIVGPEAVFGAEWATSDDNKLTLDSETGKYTWSKADVTFDEATTIEYKIVKMGVNVDYIEWIPGDGQGNLTCAISAAGVYTLTVNYDPAATTLEGILTAEKTGEAVVSDKVIYYYPDGVENANSITLAEGVTLTIIGNADKKVSSGQKITVNGKQYVSIKLSNGAQNKLTLSKDAIGITFYSYVNKKASDVTSDCYWKEVAGVSYNVETSGGKMTCFSDGDFTNPDVRTYTFDTPTKEITFNNAGTQICCLIEVEYAEQAEPEYAYYIVGPEAVFGVNWAASDDNELTLDAESGKYTWTKADVTFNEATEIEYKILKVGVNVNYEEWIPGDGQGNLTCSIDAAGVYTLTANYDPAGELEGILTAEKTGDIVGNTYTATFKTTLGWEKVYAYVWSGEGENKILGDWPGKELTADNGVYTVTIEAEEAPEFIIFNNGGNGEENQTPDLAFVDKKAYEYVMRGDANLNCEVTVSDAVLCVQFVIEKEVPTALQKTAADYNGDNNLTVSDAVGIVNIAIDAEEDPAQGAPAYGVSNSLMLNGLALNLQNTTSFVAFQMDVTLADGAVLNGVQLSERAAGMNLYYNRVGNNTWRIVGFSTEKVAISGNEGTLLTLDVTGNSNVTIGNIEFTDTYAHGYALTLGDATGIDSVNAADNSVEIYSIDGVRLNGLQKGLNVVKTADGQVRKVMMK